MLYFMLGGTLFWSILVILSIGFSFFFITGNLISLFLPVSLYPNHRESETLQHRMIVLSLYDGCNQHFIYETSLV